MRALRAWFGSHSGRIGKLYYWASLHRQIRGQRPVLVWSLGKTGTTALASAITAATGRPALHCHRVSKASIERTKTYAHQPADPRSPVAWRGEYVRWLIRIPRRRWDIVCGVRDPIARCVSTVFQDAEAYGWLLPDGSPADDSTFYDRVVELFETGRSGADWFDMELRELTGIDVMASQFEHDRGYAIHERGRFRVLVVRFEDLSVAGENALAEFLKVRDVDLHRDNVGANKNYSAAYRAFLSEVRFPQEMLAKAYESAYAQNFYTAEERAALRRRWREPGNASGES